MHPRKAEYKRILDDTDGIIAAAKLEGALFSAIVAQIDDTDDFKQDWDHLFEVFASVYKNPRAMNCFVFYDIEDNKLRRQIAKYLLQKSCQRIQKSVYLANIGKREYEEMTRAIKELNELLGEGDSIFFVPVGEYHLAEMLMIGRDVDMAFARSQKHVIFI